MASRAIDSLLNSTDAVDRELGVALLRWQDEKARQGRRRTLGREPHEILAIIDSGGSVATVIAGRVRGASRGFDEVPAEYSYEAIVVRHPERFPPDVVSLSRRRLQEAAALSEPTHVREDYERRVTVLRTLVPGAPPAGSARPRSVGIETKAYMRDPKVKAFVLNEAAGRCELCRADAPFADSDGNPFLEAHHVRPLAERGSDRVSNMVALCPNCHRAIHHSAQAVGLTAQLYDQVDRLVRE